MTDVEVGMFHCRCGERVGRWLGPYPIPPGGVGAKSAWIELPDGTHPPAYSLYRLSCPRCQRSVDGREIEVHQVMLSKEVP